MNQASVQEILSFPTNPPKNTFLSFYPQFLLFQEGEKRSLAQSLPPTHSPITSNPSSGQIPEHDHLDTLSNEVVQTSSLSIFSLFNDKVLGAEVYSSQFLEKEEVGHLYYIFAWAMRVFKVATLQENFIVTMQFLSQRSFSSWYWLKSIISIVPFQADDQIMLLQRTWNELIIAGLAHRKYSRWYQKAVLVFSYRGCPKKSALSESSYCKLTPQRDQIEDVLNLISLRCQLAGWWFRKCVFLGHPV